MRHGCTSTPVLRQGSGCSCHRWVCFESWGVPPHISNGSGSAFSRTICSSRGGRRENGSAALHFYCLARKVGQLFSTGTLAPHKDFFPRAQWVTNLFRASKLSAEEASAEFLRCFSGCRSNLQNLEAVVKHQAYERDEAVRVRIMEEVAMQQRPFKPQPLIMRFVTQFDGISRDRYKFLVLCGRSGTGKSSLARQLICDPLETLELNCAGGAEPDLRGCNRLLHRAVLFDEGTPKMVLGQKKLFQAGPNWIQLGMSTTNCHSYKQMLGRVPLIITSNTWMELCQELSPADSEWIHANQVLVPIDEDVFEPRAAVVQGFEEEAAEPAWVE